MDFTIFYRAERIAEAYKDFFSSGKKILDIGCGNGVVGKIIAERFNCEVTGTDILNYVKTNLPFRPMLREDVLPFADLEFDIAMLNDMLHHMPADNQLKVINEALRVARLVLIFEVKPTFYAKFTDWLANKIHQPFMRISFTHRDLDGWRALLSGRGFDIEYHEVKLFLESKDKKGLRWKFTRMAYYPITNYLLALQKRN